MLALVLLATSASAQEQEQKLVDRLLKPDTTLENSAQKKKFVADGVSVDKRANVTAFHVQEKEKPKKFGGTRDYSANEFAAKSFYAARDRSTFPARSTRLRQGYGVASIARSTSPILPTSRDGGKTATTREFAGQRPFLDRGKSEKSVEFQGRNKPMTIEDVRELLNKNK